MNALQDQAFQLCREAFCILAVFWAYCALWAFYQRQRPVMTLMFWALLFLPFPSCQLLALGGLFWVLVSVSRRTLSGAILIDSSCLNRWEVSGINLFCKSIYQCLLLLLQILTLKGVLRSVIFGWQWTSCLQRWWTLPETILEVKKRSTSVASMVSWYKCSLSKVCDRHPFYFPLSYFFIADYWILTIAVCTYLILADHKHQSSWIQDHRIITWTLPWLLSILWAAIGLAVVGYGDIGACKFVNATILDQLFMSKELCFNHL